MTCDSGTAPATVEGFGARIELRASDVLVERVARLLPTGVEVRRASRPDRHDAPAACIDVRFRGAGRADVSVDGELVATLSDRDQVVARTVSELHLALAAHARDGLFVHAGVVAWQGAAIVVPGPSMSGKSSLVHALVAHGADHFSDEYAVLDAAGSVHPYPKPLSIRRPGCGVDSVAPETIGRVGTSSAPVALIVATTFRPGVPWCPDDLVGVRAVMPLVHNTVAARSRPEAMLEAVAAVAASGVVCLRGERPDAMCVAGWLIERVMGLPVPERLGQPVR
ncbi:MAG: hypothetical protein ACXV8T_11615 [Acidimicrobiia bacterium]